MFNRDTSSAFRRLPRSMSAAKYGVLLSVLLVLCVTSSPAQTKALPSSQPPQTTVDDISGMYSFEREGEFVQINVEQRTAKPDKTKPLAVTGFISRYGDTDADRGAFLDHFFTKGSFDWETINFVTKPVHGVSYEFVGKLQRGAAQTRDKDGYYELRGTLTQNVVSQDKTVSSRQREITLKLFPNLDGDQMPAKKK
jgi:hypothetical protein